MEVDIAPKGLELWIWRFSCKIQKIPLGGLRGERSFVFLSLSPNLVFGLSVRCSKSESNQQLFCAFASNLERNEKG